MRNFRNILLLACLIAFLGCFTQRKSNSEPKYKLLFYATLNDSVEIHLKDTSWLYSQGCLKLNVDSINVDSIVRKKKIKYMFYYHGKEFSDCQLFDTELYDSLKKVSIIGFAIFVPCKCMDNIPVYSHSNCLNDTQKKYIVDRWYALHKINILFFQIRVSNYFNRIKMPPYTSYAGDIVNSIDCHMGQ